MDNVRVVRWLKGWGEENNFPSVVILELERDLKFNIHGVFGAPKRFKELREENNFPVLELERDLKFHIHGIFGAPKRFKGLREENNFSSVVILELERDLKA